MQHQALIQLGTSRNRRPLLESFPHRAYPKGPLPVQEIVFGTLDRVPGSAILQLPTGSGKTAIGYTFLKAIAESHGGGPLIYLVPTKTLVQQVKALHPDVAVAYGRNEHPCLYYGEENQPRADEIPCSMLVDCEHRVDQETGETEVAGAMPCPYLQQKYEAKQAKIVVCTMAFYLYTGPVFSQEFPTPAGLVIDEAHNIARVLRNCLSYDITDYHLARSIELLEEIGAGDEARILTQFLKAMTRIVRRRPSEKPVLLEDEEIRSLIDILSGLNRRELRNQVTEAVKRGKIDTVARREVLRKIEILTRDLNRYLRSLEFSLPKDGHQALGYTYAFYRKEVGEGESVQHRLVIKAYYVAGLVKKLLSPRTLAMSATIGTKDVFGWETGIQAPFYDFGSDFPAQNTRIFLPTDAPNLAVKARSKREPTRVLRRIAKACNHFNRKGIRCLVIVVSNRERAKFLELAAEERTDVLTYDYAKGVLPKHAAERFKAGEGGVLLGTVANYGEGVDLPKQMAPVIFFLRPGYPSPEDPMTQFEDRRYSGGHVWSVRNWRVMQEALQVRGRNVRASTDLGVTVFVSQQFRRFVYGCLPEWLKPAYNEKLTFDQVVRETDKLLA